MLAPWLGFAGAMNWYSAAHSRSSQRLLPGRKALLWLILDAQW